MTLNLIKSHFSCAISKSLVALPYNCPCGHLFDAVNIFTWVNTNNTCPVSRLPLLVQDLTFNNTVYQFLQELRLTDDTDVHDCATTTATEISRGDDTIAMDDFTGTNDLGIQTDEFPPLVEPFVYLGNEIITVANLNENERRYLGCGKLVDLADGIFNPISTNPHLEQVVDRFNMEYIRTLIPIKADHPNIVINKYAYQTRFDLVATAKLLCRQGYFVYDLFKIGKHDDLNQYVLYSTPILVTGQRNILSKYKRLTN